MKATKRHRIVPVSVIGNGFVGGAVANGFAKQSPLVYDVDPARSNCAMEEALGAIFIFVCLPTPMVSAEGGQADLSILESFFDRVAGMVGEGFPGIFVLKSTVPVGTTKRLQEKHPHLQLVHNPEFLTAANANKDFLTADRTVLGGSSQDALAAVARLYASQFPSIPIQTMTSNESELVKYAANCFLATKVAFFNEIKLLADAVGADYEKVAGGVAADKRIGPSHTRVPGPDGDYGFGGTCFPKDLNALIHTVETLTQGGGVEHYQYRHPKSTLFRAVWERNKELRQEWDWSKSPSAVSTATKPNKA